MWAKCIITPNTDPSPVRSAAVSYSSSDLILRPAIRAIIRSVVHLAPRNIIVDLARPLARHCVHPPFSLNGSLSRPVRFEVRAGGPAGSSFGSSGPTGSSTTSRERTGGGRRTVERTSLLALRAEGPFSRPHVMTPPSAIPPTRAFCQIRPAPSVACRARPRGSLRATDGGRRLTGEISHDAIIAHLPILLGDQERGLSLLELMSTAVDARNRPSQSRVA